MALTKISAPYYSKHYPEFINFGRFGAIFGHELAHAFIGGPLSSLKRTLSNRKCLRDQYLASGVS